VVAEATGQGGRVAGQRSGPVLVVADACGVGAQVEPPQVDQGLLVEVVLAAGAGVLGMVVGVDEQVGHRRA
jgi:hypothetical protein